LDNFEGKKIDLEEKKKIFHLKKKLILINFCPKVNLVGMRI